jgi:acetylornithine deacetylase
MKEVTDLLLDLVAIPSVSSMSNQPLLDYVAGCLDPRLWKTRVFSYTDPSGTPKGNLVAATGAASASHVELALLCHSDTVPFDPAWQEAVHPVLRNDRVYGRGSCDVKGFLACALAALSEVDLEHLTKPIALIVTADEEVGFVGAKYLAAEHALSTRYLLIGEPTGLCPVSAGKGYALATITVRGKEGHSAFPSSGRSAIFDSARVIEAIEGIALGLEREQNAAFDPPFTTLNIGLIQGGTAKNIVPGQCRLTVEWRPIPGTDPQLVVKRIRQELTDLGQSHPGFNAELDVKRADPPFTPSSTHALQDLLTELTGRPPRTIAFGSEAAHVRNLANEIIVIGPGDMETAHRTGEFVTVVDLRECVACLRSAIERLCA